MLKSFLLLFRFYLFWLLFFFLERFIFLAYFYHKLRDIPFSEILQTFVFGVRMDASMAGYISIVPLIFFLIIWIVPRIPFKEYILRAYIVILIVLFSLITVINFNIYREWGSKLNSKALELFFNSPREALASGASSPLLLSTVVFLTLGISAIALSRFMIRYQSPENKLGVGTKLGAGIVFLLALFLAIRGGLDASPINQSMAYFSNRPLLNHAAINTEWNLVHDLLKQDFNNKNPYRYYKNDEAISIVRNLYKENPNDTSMSILNHSKPNVVLVILESFTADLIEKLGGEKGITPNIDKLISQGLFFDHIYASGDRTDKGLIAVLSAFPSQATRSIIRLNDKQEKLPAISQLFKKNGYVTSFYYGGQSEFFNIKSYLLSHDFNKLVDKSAFNNEDMSSWGAFDHKVFQQNLIDLNVSKEPFFSTILTLSNHEPFQLPSPPRFPGDRVEDKFRSTAYYTDASLGEYLKQASSQDWYKNTLFIIVADHGHRLPKNTYEIYDPGRFRIPLLFYGNVLKNKYKGMVVSTIGNQTDLAATLLSQLKVPHDEFKWSRNLLNQNAAGFSFFSWDNGFGFATQDQTISFDNPSQQIIYHKKIKNNESDSTSLRIGKAYMQEVFQTFLNY
ncbi:sulfatase-like hydrolase/transferase [Flavihumibacter sp. R14]|nr:sulfatase-like hydrolase/transferase [Flavihumibacter soli]